MPSNGGQKEEANVMEQDEMVAVLIETLMVEKDNDWWLDSKATCHVTPFKNVCKTYEKMYGEKTVYMGNSSTSTIMGFELKKDLSNELESNVQLKDVDPISLSKPMIDPSPSIVVKTTILEAIELRRIKRCRIEKDLGIKVIRKENEYILTQSHYIEKMFKKFNYFDYKPSKAPIDPHNSLLPNIGDSVN
ncbi:hypothetical protein GH714_000068 [Hevea brasiliensis]|uniref:Retrovirus-related Pol polyprotein from transposon TNT 1-94-like beta-barrel domain-containing protein n=1 Tax=Hevea brasiliensis TaxID=3981 RepID=A0A6A6K928_HEVBR|nr:hypothetical protein GH714_000068 [Hevea brasiliensis]